MQALKSFFKSKRNVILTVVGVIVVILALLAGTGTLGELTKSPEKQPAKELTPAGNKKSGHELTDKKNDAETYMRKVCEGKGFQSAEAYKSNEAPYHYAVVGAGNPSGYGGVSAGPFLDDLKLLWSNPEKMQLTACLSRFNEKDTGLVCTYQVGSPTKLHKAEYKLEVYETKTRKHIKTTNLPDIGDAACPPEGSSQATVSPETEKVFTGVNGKALTDALLPLTTP